MKKKFILLAILAMLILPIRGFAATSMNLEETLKEEEIEYNSKDYKPKDNAITIYMFRGKGCTHCKDFLNFLSSILKDYGKYFKLESYEVWYNEENGDLMDAAAYTLGEEVTGVPYIIIGNKTFAGYGENYADEIKSTIKELYNSDIRYDVMENLIYPEPEEETNTSGKISIDEATMKTNTTVRVFVAATIVLFVLIKMFLSPKTVVEETNLEETEKAINVNAEETKEIKKVKTEAPKKITENAKETSKKSTNDSHKKSNKSTNNVEKPSKNKQNAKH